MRVSLAAFGTFLLFCLGVLQSQTVPVHFEVASVRLAEFYGPVRHRETNRINYEGIDATELVMRAFGLPRFLIVWPDWVPAGGPRSAKWDPRYYQIQATMPPDTNSSQLQLMLQDLLRSRFHFVEHKETKPFLQYEVTIADTGLMMHPSPPVDMSKASPQLAGNDNIERILRGPLLRLQISPDGLRLKGQATVAIIGDFLNPYLSYPLVDKTGLGNKYFDIDIPWSFNPNDPPPSPDLPVNKAGPSYVKELTTTMLKALGLKVQSRSLATEFLVIDNMDHAPTDN